MSSTPTKAEKEHLDYLRSLEIEKELRAKAHAWVENARELDALRERLRLAEEFIRSHKHYDHTDVPRCISCHKPADFHEDDCELQKILGKEKGME